MLFCLAHLCGFGVDNTLKTDAAGIFKIIPFCHRKESSTYSDLLKDCTHLSLMDDLYNTFWNSQKECPTTNEDGTLCIDCTKSISLDTHPCSLISSSPNMFVVLLAGNIHSILSGMIYLIKLKNNIYFIESVVSEDGTFATFRGIALHDQNVERKPDFKKKGFSWQFVTGGVNRKNGECIFIKPDVKISLITEEV